MRKTTLVFNSLVVVFFACFLTFTLVARQHLDALAREFVTEKTLSYSGPVAELAGKALDSPIVKKLLSDDQQTAIRKELAGYHNDPVAYVADLTSKKLRDAPVENANPILEKVAFFKSKVRTFYDDTLNALIADLQVFSISNLLAAMIALGLAYYSPSDIRKPIVWFSFLMCVAVLYCTYLYVDDLTFFRIMFRLHLGWRYAAFLCAVIAGVYLDYGRHYKATGPSGAFGLAGNTDSTGRSTAATR